MTDRFKHGRKPGGPMYYNYEVTYKYMPFNLQAALGYAQFQRLDELVGMKRAIWQKYKERLAGIEDIEFNAEPEGSRLKRRHLIALREAEGVSEGESVRSYIANVVEVQ